MSNDATRTRARDAAGPDRALLELERFLPYQLNVLMEAVSRSLSKLYGERYGLSVPEWRVIATLGQYRTMTAKQIGAHSRMNKTMVSRAVSALQRRGVVRRDRNANDRREEFLSLSDEGREIYDDLAPRAARFADTLLEALSVEERAHFTQMLWRLEERAKQISAARGKDII